MMCIKLQNLRSIIEIDTLTMIDGNAMYVKALQWKTGSS
jgi:hypothetical protein